MRTIRTCRHSHPAGSVRTRVGRAERRRSSKTGRLALAVALVVVGLVVATMTGGGVGRAEASVAGPASLDPVQTVSCPDVGSVEVALSRGVAVGPLPTGVHLEVGYRATDARSKKIVVGGPRPGRLVCESVPFASLAPGQVSATDHPDGVAPGDRLTGSWQVSIAVNISDPADSLADPLSGPSVSATPSSSGFSFDAPVRAYLAGRAGTASVAVFDANSGASYFLNPTSFITASVVKVDILATLLHQAQEANRPLTATEQATATQMIEFSDNNAATALWDEVGGAPAVAAFNRLIGLSATVPGPGGFWGLTTTTSADQVILMPRRGLPERGALR